MPLLGVYKLVWQGMFSFDRNISSIIQGTHDFVEPSWKVYPSFRLSISNPATMSLAAILSQPHRNVPQQRRSIYWDTVLDTASSYSSDQDPSNDSTATSFSSSSSDPVCAHQAPPLPPSPTLTRLTSTTTGLPSSSATLDRPHPCPLCPARFRQRSHLTAHYRVVHYKCKPFVCSYCNHSFGKKYDLKMHVAAVHFRVRAFSCDQCHKSFAKKSNLSRHQSHRHPGQTRSQN